MRKSLILTITAALLLAAVLCTAGCVSEDKIVGLWYTEDENGFTYVQFSPDKSAVFAVQKRDGTTETADAVWKAEGNSIYTVTLNGKDISCTLNAKRGVLDMNGVLYQKTVSPISGVSQLDSSLDRNASYFYNKSVKGISLVENITISIEAD